MQEDFGRKVGIDLLNGVIIIDYDDWGFNPNDGSVELYNPKTVFHICDETNILTGMFDIIPSETDNKGNYTNDLVPLLWRPIWFTRITNGIPTKVIGAQTTLPSNYGSKNIKKMISIFDSGALGID
jgi:hypothetical protein